MVFQQLSAAPEATVSNENTTVIIAALITGVLSFYGSKWLYNGKGKIDVARARFYNAYFSIFKAIEPYLFSEIDLEHAKEMAPVFKDVLETHYELINPYLSAWLKTFLHDLQKEKIEQQRFEQICSLVDKEYEELKKQLYLPKRSFRFKLQNDQLTKSTTDTVKQVSIKIVQGLVLIALCLVVYAVFDVIKQVLTAIMH